MYEYQEVTNEEGLTLAKEINAIYKRTSAKSQQHGGIDDLFKVLGKKFLNPNFEITSNLTKEELIKREEKKKRSEIKKLHQQQLQKKKKNCC